MPNPLDWLGAVLPRESGPAPSRQRVADENKRKQKQRGEQSQLRKDIGTLGDIASDFVGGITGFGGDESQTAYGIGELLDAGSDLLPGKAAAGKALSMAGMPFAWYKAQGKVPRHGLVHGTPATFEKIDPSYTSPGAHNMDFYGSPSPDMSNQFWEQGQNDFAGPRGMSLPFEPDAKNVLDLIDVDPRDMHKVIRNMEPDVQARYMEYFNDMMSKGATSDEAYRTLASVVGVPKGVVEKSGFDAVRYPYGDRLDEAGNRVKDEAWGVSNKVPIRSTYGRAPLNDAAERADMFNKDIAAEKAEPQLMPKAGDILPSGRRFAQRAEPKPKTQAPKEAGPKRMSLAELMATSEPKKTRKIKLRDGRVIDVTEEEFKRMTGGRR